VGVEVEVQCTRNVDLGQNFKKVKYVLSLTAKINRPLFVVKSPPKTDFRALQNVSWHQKLTFMPSKTSHGIWREAVARARTFQTQIEDQ
jgi:hypothetical protein